MRRPARPAVRIGGHRGPYTGGMSTDPVPQRLSDADRDAASDLLRTHFEAGRLDESEFTERMGAALAARFASDIVPLFADLPEPHPVLPGQDPTPPLPAGWEPPGGRTPAASRSDSPAPPVPATAPTWVPLAKGLLWPVCLLAGFIVGNWVVFIMIAIIGSVILQNINPGRTPPPQITR